MAYVSAAGALRAFLASPDIHPVVAADEDAVVRLAILELDELRAQVVAVSSVRERALLCVCGRAHHGMAGRRPQQRERQHNIMCRESLVFRAVARHGCSQLYATCRW